MKTKRRRWTESVVVGSLEGVSRPWGQDVSRVAQGVTVTSRNTEVYSESSGMY